MSAHPSAVSFRWFFNNSEHQEWKDHADFSQSGLKSQIEFLPKTSKDYGNLYCIAENAIGVQSEPCSFQIVPTGDAQLSSTLLEFDIIRPITNNNNIMTTNYKAGNILQIKTKR